MKSGKLSQKIGNQVEIKSNAIELEWKCNEQISIENVTVQLKYIEQKWNGKIIESKTTNQVECKFCKMGLKGKGNTIKKR